MNLIALVIVSMPHSNIVLTCFCRAIRLQVVLPSESTAEFVAAAAWQHLQSVGSKQWLKSQSTVAGTS